MPASIAVLSDVHGNLPALEAVLAEVEAEGFDVVVSGGDQVSGPMPAESLERLEACALPVRWVRGNADRLAVHPGDGAHDSDRHAHAALGDEQRARIDAWEATVTVGDVLFCHAVPGNDEDKVTMLTPPERLAGFLEGVDARIVVAGHVHHQFVLEGRWVNAGSVGMPYEGRPGAFWLALRDGVPEFRRTDYDVDAAIARLGADDELAEILRGRYTAREAAQALEP